MEVEIALSNAEVPVEEVKELLLHQIDLRSREAKVSPSGYRTVSSPMLVLGRRVIQILRSQDERGKEDAVHRATHSFGDWR